MKKLLVLVLVVCCSCSYSFNSWSQMQDEGTTTTTVIEEQGDVQEITETTVTIENKTTGDILDGDTGVVATRYEGDMDQDWGGIGSASMVTCPSQVGGTGKCAKGTSSTLTTFQQNINIAQFHIEDGGALNWSLDAWHSQNNTELYFELKGYNNNVLLWTDKTDLASGTTDYAGNYDYSGGLDKLFVSVGGKNNYYFDNVQLDVQYNVISTVVTTYLQYIETQVMLNETVTSNDTYDYEDTTPEPSYEEMDNYDVGLPEIAIIEVMPTETVVFEQTVEYAPIVETNSFEPELVTMETVVEDIQAVMSVPDIQEPVEAIETPQVEPEVETETVIVENTTEEPTVEEVKEPVDAQETEVAVVEDNEPTIEPEAKEEVVEEVKEEVKEDVKEESKPEPKEVAKEEPKKEEVKEVKVADKPTKKQEAKQEKAKEIMAGFDSQYDAVAQLTTLALVNALGADITTYQQVPTQVQPTWYESKEIYAETMLQDPLGNYFGVRDSLVFEQMLGKQYE